MQIKNKTKKLLSDLGYENSEVSILLTNDEEIQDLNNKFRRKNKPTDVLSFAMSEGESLSSGSKQLLGDVVISFTTAEKQAAKRAIPLEEEINRLLIHGLLHLLGYEHENVKESVAQQMENKEQELLELLSE